jgi:hypothetical protein
MTILIGWASLSVGIVMGAMWRSLCEKQPQKDATIGSGSFNWHRLGLEQQRWQIRPEAKREKRSA